MRAVNGESCQFCCYGCCIAYQVKSGRSEASEAAWFLVRLGVGSFLSMNIMLFSFAVYGRVQRCRRVGAAHDSSVAVGARDARGADSRRTVPARDLVAGPARPFELLGAHRSRRLAAYAYSTLAVFQRGGHLYFDTASMVLMLFTLGRYLEAAGRARASRDLAPLLAAESELATVVEGGKEHRRPVREVRAGMLIRVRPGERIPVDGVIVEGSSLIDDAVITGESRQIAKAVGASVLAGSINLDGPLLIRSSGAGERHAGPKSAARFVTRFAVEPHAAYRRPPGEVLRAARAGPRLLTLLYWAHRLPFDRALLVALSVLVVACPCAVGLAAPLATSLGIGQLARHGCLVRSPARSKRWPARA